MKSFKDIRNLSEESPIALLGKKLGKVAHRKEYEAAIEMMISGKKAADAARIFRHVDARELQKMFDALSEGVELDEAAMYVVMNKKTGKAVSKPMSMGAALDSYDSQGGNAKGLAVVKTDDKRLKESVEIEEARSSTLADLDVEEGDKIKFYASKANPRQEATVVGFGKNGKVDVKVKGSNRIVSLSWTHEAVFAESVEIEEGLVNKARAWNYDRLARRSFDKSQKDTNLYTNEPEDGKEDEVVKNRKKFNARSTKAKDLRKESVDLEEAIITYLNDKGKKVTGRVAKRSTNSPKGYFLDTGEFVSQQRVIATESLDEVEIEEGRYDQYGSASPSSSGEGATAGRSAKKHSRYDRYRDRMKAGANEFDRRMARKRGEGKQLKLKFEELKAKYKKEES